MKKQNWEAVDEGTSFPQLPAGGYVVRIISVQDVPEREYIWLVYDIVEGPHRAFFSDEFGREHPAAHRFVRSYKETARGMFKAFLKRLEESNAGFSVEAWQVRSDERDFVGLLVGAVFQYEDYTDETGEDRSRRNCTGVYSVEQVRQGNYKLPARKDSRTKVESVGSGVGVGGAGAADGASSTAADDDLPF